MLYYLLAMVFLIFHGPIHSSNEANGRLSLNEISASDRESLERFIKHMITQESFGYVLFGHKPMISSDVLKPRSTRRAGYNKPNISYQDYVLCADCRVCKKYDHLFCGKNYTFRIVDDGSSYEILFINKKKCLGVIQTNIQLFKKRLGFSITPEFILSQIELKNNILDDVLNGYEDLLGILLGFGTHNSRLFQKRSTLNHQGKYRPPFDFDKINEVYQVKLSGFGSDDILNFVDLPYFVEDSTYPQNRFLRQKYLNAQKTISRFYSSSRFLEPTLEMIGSVQQFPIKVSKVMIYAMNGYISGF